MNRDIILCGVGGQGTVLASKIIAAAAMDEGNTAHSAETIGMAQRGGPVTSHVRIGEDVYSPLIPYGSADILLAFEPSEAVRNLKYIKPDGVVIVNTCAIKPVTENLKKSGYSGEVMTEYLASKCDCVFVSSDEVCKPFGSVKFFNIIMLGIAAGSGRLGIAKETLLRRIKAQVRAQFAEANLKAFETGYKMGREAYHEN
ncbi:MAG: indolepyruvate oxidoreductase subunit beta [Lachnospiraceae bacterium]|nr:indolepyruvate oxidoreductase subunit beta [Lachnospiraceae bacterium]